MEDIVTETLDTSGSERAESGPVSDVDAPDEKKEFDTIENSEGVR